MGSISFNPGPFTLSYITPYRLRPILDSLFSQAQCFYSFPTSVACRHQKLITSWLHSMLSDPASLRSRSSVSTSLCSVIWPVFRTRLLTALLVKWASCIASTSILCVSVVWFISPPCPEWSFRMFPGLSPHVQGSDMQWCTCVFLLFVFCLAISHLWSLCSVSLWGLFFFLFLNCGLVLISEPASADVSVVLWFE